ncbi:ABC transporter ATP-binding protein [Gammaproteobacteria bacterium]|nr:ABC transporter ATP-binding protein [Gammaproteobacteria bacterium]MDC1284529.1 ABC transporter ATP-binding protein [Gammaproteobacteria bacterium]
MSLLIVNGLSTEIRGRGESNLVVRDISFQVERGETLALVGESGSGKSMTALSIARLLPPAARVSAGEIKLSGRDLMQISEREMRDVRGSKIAMIFQEPMNSLNPVLTIGDQIAECVRRHQSVTRSAARQQSIELLAAVGLPAPQRNIDEYPHQLSGGMRQRVMIAIALAAQPDLLIADEPTTALDVTIQAQVLDLLKDLQSQFNMGLLFITHDLAVVKQTADRIAVMHQGELVEHGTNEAFFASPKHAYSRALLAAIPTAQKRLQRDLEQDAKRVSAVAQPEAEDAAGPILSVRNLQVHFPIRGGVFRRAVDYVRAVDDVSFDLHAGKTLALVGESGCGKTTVGKAILQLLKSNQGSVQFQQRDLQTLGNEDLRKIRQDLQIVFQDPYSSLNPRMLVGDILEEGMTALAVLKTTQDRKRKIKLLLDQVGLPADSVLRYPHEFSGGQRQRISIARALAVEPKLIVCDEPTSALDVSVQAQVLNLLIDLQEELGMSYLFITHDMAVVSYLADEVAVMHQGQIVEQGPTEQILLQPQHHYTQKLLAAVPSL